MNEHIRPQPRLQSRLLMGLALLVATVAIVAVPPASAQIEPQRLSYAVWLERPGLIPLLCGEVYREDTDPRTYTEHWVLFPDYVAPDLKNGYQIRLDPGYRVYEDTRDFLARVPFAHGAQYVKQEVSTYAELPPVTCSTFERGGAGDVADALINSGVGGDGASRKNYGGSGSLTASLDNGAVRHGLLRFDLGAVPRTATVTSAEVELTVLLQGGAPVRAHRVTAPWSEGTVTWDSFGGAFEAAPVAVFPAASAGQRARADLTDLAQAWVSGGLDNDGILLERDAGTTVFASSEGGAPGQRPRLTICWF